MSSVLDEYIKKEVEEKVTKKVAEDRKEQATNTAITMLKDGIAIEVIAKYLPSLSLDFIKQLQQQSKQV